jgi:membrane-bound lytic murein transglycosylase D
MVAYCSFFVLSGLANAGVVGMELVSRPEQHLRPIIPFEQFAVDARLRSNMNFWVQIYSKYSSSEGLIHDAKYIDHVYQVVDLKQGEGTFSQKIKRAKEKWKTLLLSVHRKQNAPETMTEEESQVYRLFADVNEPNKYLNAAGRKRLRFQLGQKDNFLEGYRQSGRYLSLMEEIFKNAGLPIELTRLPFVESSFNVRARSKVGASGIWQFMRSTGRLFLKVGEAVDERNDPIRATEAAALLLKGNYESLGKWPLAVTAYNHGRKGMMRAVRMVGSEELEDVVDSYKGRTFGFASGNFFTEFLAAVEVEKNAEKYFGKVERAKPIPFVEVRIPDYINLGELARFMKLDMPALRDLNPAVSEAVYTGKLLIPAGYSLRLPYDGSAPKETIVKAFLAGYSEIPSTYKLPAQPFAKYAKRSKRSKIR